MILNKRLKYIGLLCPIKIYNCESMILFDSDGFSLIGVGNLLVYLSTFYPIAEEIFFWLCF